MVQLLKTKVVTDRMEAAGDWYVCDGIGRLKMGNTILGQSEWIIMEKLWEQQPRTIMQLFHALEVDPGWSKSTVNTLLGRMVDKGIIDYEDGGKARQYYPKIKREEAALAETKSLLDRVYKGSVGMMMSTLVKQRNFTKEEIQELYDILDGLEGREN